MGLEDVCKLSLSHTLIHICRSVCESTFGERVNEPDAFEKRKSRESKTHTHTDHATVRSPLVVVVVVGHLCLRLDPSESSSCTL